MAKTFNSNIIFHGNLPNHKLMDILGSSKYFISTSMYEGNSKVLLEALASGCLVFAADIKNNSEIITHEQTGILFKLKEAELIIHLINIVMMKFVEKFLKTQLCTFLRIIHLVKYLTMSIQIILGFLDKETKKSF